MKKVYLLKTEGSNYKIGTSKHPEKRLRQLQTGNQETLELVGSYESKFASLIETTLHRQFSHLKRSGEWFDLSLEHEVDFIEKCKKIEETFSFLNDNDNIFIKKILTF